MLQGVSKITDMFEKSIKTKRAEMLIHHLLQYDWDNSDFRKQMALQATTPYFCYAWWMLGKKKRSLDFSD